MSYTRAAREAPPEFGIVSGCFTGAWDIHRELTMLVRRLKGERVLDIGPAPEPTTYDIGAMASNTLRIQTRTVAVVAELKALLHQSP